MVGCKILGPGIDTMRSANLWRWLPATVFLVIGALIQHLTYLQWDVAWLLAESKMLLAGGHYGKEFFDPNPPMILYLYFPIIGLAKYTFLNLIEATRVYTLLVGIISWLISLLYIDKIFASHENLKKNLVLAAIALAYFILPTYQFAQREHFVIMLSTPYILSVIAIMQNRPIKSRGWRCGVGVLAGIGFSIKPFFLLIPIITECYVLIVGSRFLRFKNISLFFRTENIALLMTVVLYFLSIYLVTPSYYTLVLPFVSHFYMGYAAVPRWDLLSAYWVDVCLITLLLALLVGYFYKVGDILWIAMLVAVCYLLFFLVNAQPWYYHLIPALAYSLILLSIIFGIIMTVMIKFWIQMVCILLGIIALVGLFLGIYNDFRSFHYLQSSSNYISTHLINRLKQQPQLKSLYAFSVYPGVSAVPALYAHVKNCSRFTGFWMMPDINQQLQKKNINATQKLRLNAAINYVRNSVVEDFQQCRPDLVIVDVGKNKPYFKGIPFDYIKFFSSDKRFQTIWKNYCYQETINGHFALYLRCSYGFRFSTEERLSGQ